MVRLIPRLLASAVLVIVAAWLLSISIWWIGQFGWFPVSTGQFVATSVVVFSAAGAAWSVYRSVPLATVGLIAASSLSLVAYYAVWYAACHSCDAGGEWTRSDEFQIALMIIPILAGFGIAFVVVGALASALLEHSLARLRNRSSPQT